MTERHETIRQLINKCNSLAQNDYKCMHDRDGNMIHVELCKQLKFDHTETWHMRKTESVLENETYKVFNDFKIQTDRPTLIRRPDSFS